MKWKTDSRREFFLKINFSSVSSQCFEPFAEFSKKPKVENLDLFFKLTRKIYQIVQIPFSLKLDFPWKTLTKIIYFFSYQLFQLWQDNKILSVMFLPFRLVIRIENEKLERGKSRYWFEIKCIYKVINSWFTIKIACRCLTR